MTPIEVGDLTDVESWTGAENLPIPLGKHLCEIVNAEEKEASTGSPQVILEWRVLGGPYADRTSREWLVILPQTLGKVKAFLEALGWPLTPGKFVMPVAELVGRRSVITIGEEPYKGKLTTRVVAHQPASTPIPVEAPLPASVAAIIAAEPDHDDIPF